MDPLVEKAKTDLAEVKAEVSTLLAKQKKLEAFLAIYGEQPSQSDLYRSVMSRLADGPAALALSRPSAKDRITSAVADILADGEPRHTRALLAILEKNGIEVGGSDKVIALSVLLSRDPRFVANRKIGWSLKK